MTNAGNDLGLKEIHCENPLGPARFNVGAELAKLFKKGTQADSLSMRVAV
jgi:hypothetical protein